MPDHAHVSNYEERIRKAQAAMAQANVDLLTLNFSANSTCLTGIPYPRPNPTGEAFPTDWLRTAILTPERAQYSSPVGRLASLKVMPRPVRG